MGAQGTVALDFGAFPGSEEASIVVTGQTAILSGSLAEAWLFPAQTTDHSPDEHRAEEIQVMAGNVIAGTGFTIYGLHQHAFAGQGTSTYGQWNVAWAWN